MIRTPPLVNDKMKTDSHRACRQFERYILYRQGDPIKGQKALAGKPIATIFYDQNGKTETHYHRREENGEHNPSSASENPKGLEAKSR